MLRLRAVRSPLRIVLTVRLDTLRPVALRAPCRHHLSKRKFERTAFTRSWGRRAIAEDATSTGKKFQIGLVGGLAPYVVLWNQGKLVVGNFTPASLLGFLLPILALSLLTGYVASLYDEKQPL